MHAVYRCRLYESPNKNINIKNGMDQVINEMVLTVINTSDHNPTLGGVPMFNDTSPIIPAIIRGIEPALFNIKREWEEE